MERSAKRIRAKGNYWNEVQDRAVIDYVKESEPKVRNEIFTKHLYPQLHAMSTTILRRYYKAENESLVLDSIAHVVEKAINNFDPSKAKSYSYFQTVIKHHLYNALGTGAAAQARARKYDSLDKFNDYDNIPSELTYTDELWNEEEYRDSVLQRLYRLKRRGLKRGTLLMIDVFIDLLKSQRMHSKEYVTLSLLIALNSCCSDTLNRHARSLGIKFSFSTIDRINKQLAIYAEKHGIPFSGHELATIEPWQEIALNKAVVVEELALASI